MSIKNALASLLPNEAKSFSRTLTDSLATAYEEEIGSWYDDEDTGDEANWRYWCACTDNWGDESKPEEFLEEDPYYDEQFYNDDFLPRP